MNPTIRKLNEILEQADNISIYYRRRFYKLSSPEIPTKAAVDFVMDSLREPNDAS